MMDIWQMGMVDNGNVGFERGKWSLIKAANARRHRWLGCFGTWGTLSCAMIDHATCLFNAEEWTPLLWIEIAVLVPGWRVYCISVF